MDRRQGRQWGLAGGGGKDSGNMGNTDSGGAGGQAGLWRAAGIPGGFCRIFLLGN